MRWKRSSKPRAAISGHAASNRSLQRLSVSAYEGPNQATSVSSSPAAFAPASPNAAGDGSIPPGKM